MALRSSTARRTARGEVVGMTENLQFPVAGQAG